MLPRLLILDDVFGRIVPDGRNTHRENLCGHFLWRDVTDDPAARASRSSISKPVADAVFYRAQFPPCAKVGDTVENDLEAALEVVRRGWPETKAGRGGQKAELPWSMIFLDLCFYTGQVTEESHRQKPGMPEGRMGDDDPRSYFGLTLLDAINREFPELPIFILSSNPREEVSLEFSRRGALGFIARDDLRGPELLEQALWHHGLLPDPAGEVIGNSLSVLLALREARRAARHGQNILIHGERGTGKELLARYLHKNTPPKQARAQRPWVVVNPAALSPSLFAAELFGIEGKQGNSTGGRLGLLEMADGGDVFLDEIADVPAKMQAALLRVLEEKRIARMGGIKSRPLDLRFLAATRLDPDHDPVGVRGELLDRLRAGGTIWLPPLRERAGDIPLLAERFLREAEDRRQGVLRRSITPEAMEKLLHHDWPGNVRELRAAVFDAVNRQPDVEFLVPDHLRLGDASADATPGKRASSRTRRALLDDDGKDLQALINQISILSFDGADVGQWAGKLNTVQHEHMRLVARMIQAALDATKRRTPGKPKGELQIHPAAKLLTGNAALTASKAADLFKRLLGPIQDELEGDLLESYRTAIRLRPKSGTKSVPHMKVAQPLSS